MSAPFDTHSYPVVPSTEGTNTGSQFGTDSKFGSTSQQSQDYMPSSQQDSFGQHNTGLSGQHSGLGGSTTGHSTTGHSTTGTNSATGGALNDPGQTAANVTNKIVDSMVCFHVNKFDKLCLLTIT